LRATRAGGKSGHLPVLFAAGEHKTEHPEPERGTPDSTMFYFATPAVGKIGKGSG